MYCKSHKLDVDVSPIRIKLYAARNSVIAKSRLVNELVKVQLLESYCLPLLTYCIDSLYLRLLDLQQLSI